MGSKNLRLKLRLAVVAASLCLLAAGWTLKSSAQQPGGGGPSANVPAAAGQVKRLGHHAQCAPTLREGVRPARKPTAHRAASTTRSAARVSMAASTSSACHSPESRKNVATR